MLSLDPVTQAAYDAFSAAADRAQAILDVMTGTISVRVYEGSTLVGQGTMASPWAVRSGDTLTVGESTAFQVLQDGDPDPGAWSLRFENPDGRWVRGTFGLYGSDADFRWRREDSNAPAPWRTGQYGSIGVAVANALDASGYGGPVTGLVATVNSSTSVTLNWNAYAGATAYQVYRSTTQGSLGTLVLTSTATTYSNSGHTAGTTYYYTVRPVVGGSGVASAQASIVVTTVGAGTLLLFDGFDYDVGRLEANSTALPKFTAAGWSAIKRMPTDASSGGYIHTMTQAEMQATTGYSGPLPGGGSRVLKIEALNRAGGTDIYLQYGSGAANSVPANVWFQFWIYINRYGSEISAVENRHKFLYPSNNSYPSNTDKWLISLSAIPHNTLSNDVGPYGNPSTGQAFVIMRDAMTGSPYYAPGGSDNGSKLGPSLQTAANGHIPPNQWYCVKIHLDTSNNNSGVFETWLRPYGGAWRKVSEWIGGVTPNFTWTGFGAGGHQYFRMPTTIGWSDRPDGAFYYMDDFAMADSESALPQYG